MAITCGANMNFDRLRFVAERADMGEQREALFAVTVPEARGSFKRFCELIGNRSVTEFNYRIADASQAHIFVGLSIQKREEAAVGTHLQARRASRPSTSPTTISPNSTCATWSEDAAPGPGRTAAAL